MQAAPLFPVAPTFEFPWAEEAPLLEGLIAEINRATPLNLTGWRRIDDGQNPTYQLFADGTREPRYLLKIPIRAGYPAVATVRACGGLLWEAGIGDYRVVYASGESKWVPYGCFVQPWLPGQALAWDDAYEHDFSWLDDFIRALKPVHQITLPYFGYLAQGPQYPTLYDYFANLETVINHSFGQQLQPEATIRARERAGIATAGFLTATFEKVRTLAAKIKSPVQPVLIHGDMLPSNLLYAESGPMLIDWDEARAGWWVYEIARTLYYCPYPGLLDYFLDRYDHGPVTRDEIGIGIRLEHVRQQLRYLCIHTFNTTGKTQARAAVVPIEARVTQLLEQSNFDWLSMSFNIK